MVSYFFKSYSEYTIFLLACILSIFFFFDEEPFLDPTDWNIVHSLLFLISLLVVVWENVIRAKFGQFVFKDQVLLYSTFSFWFSLENWSRLIVMFFCYHCLSPLELELAETVEVYSGLQVWLGKQVLQALPLVLFTYFLTFWINANLNWLSYRSLITLSFLSVTLLIFSFLLLLWDFLISSITGIDFKNNYTTLYNSSRSSITYDMSLFVHDTFDWHMSSSNNFVFRFEDSYCFFLQLFNIVALYTAVVIWVFWLIDIFNAHTVNYSKNSQGPSQTFFGVVIRWTEHAVWSLFYGIFSVMLVGLRIYFNIGLDLNF